jgi:hypothetical protein
MSDGDDDFVWWKVLPIYSFLLFIMLGYLAYHGFSEFLSFFALFVILFSVYPIYMSFEEIYVKYIGGNKDGKIRYEGLSRFYLSGKAIYLFNNYKISSSTERRINRCIYFYFTICFTFIFVLPNIKEYIPLQLFLFLVFTTLVWYRTGAGVPKTWRQSLKRFGVGVAGVLSGLVIALVLRWLFALVL